MRNWTGPILTLSLFASAAQAHHSLSNYDQGRNVSADGVVEEFHFVNPHPVLMIGVTDMADLAAAVEKAGRRADTTTAPKPIHAAVRGALLTS